MDTKYESFFVDKLNNIKECKSELINEKNNFSLERKKISGKQKQIWKTKSKDNFWRICSPDSKNHMKKLFVRSNENIERKYKILFGDDPELAEETYSNDVFKSYQTFDELKTQNRYRQHDRMKKTKYKITDKYCGEKQIFCDDKSRLDISGVARKHSDKNHNTVIKKEPCEDLANGLYISNTQHSKPGPLCSKIRAGINEKHISNVSSKSHQSSPQSSEKEPNSETMSQSPRHHKYSCNSCDKNFSSKSLLKDHLYSHNQRIKSETKESHKFQCKRCSKSFQYKHVLNRHEFTHQKEKPLKCHLCNEGFTRSDALKVHQIKAHTEIRPFPCTICDKSFDYPHVLRRHVQNIHKRKKTKK